ncbi:uncharacterized protein AB9X84_023568 isoform 1-T1 [Acanthopagrus schlegelii]
MGLVQCVLIVLMLSAQSVFTFPSATMKGTKCETMCPAGTYQKSCTECASCSPGSYTTDWNEEDSCHICYLDCRPVYHLKVVQNCTSTSDVKCSCEAGFECSEWVTLPTHCKYCRKIQATTGAGTTISDQDKHTPSSASSGHSSTSTKPCQIPKCGSKIGPTAENGTNLKQDKMSSQLAAILCPVIVMGCVALMILFFVRRPGDESCFKQAIALLICNERGRDASHKSKESTHQFPRDSFSAKQPPPLSAANLGPVHVHNPGTVIFSLLSQFTGQVGPTIEAGKVAERTRGEEEEEEERDCPVFHPTSSPSVHLSEEERSGEDDSIFFPSQEQGKDYHVSKEEAL